MVRLLVGAVHFHACQFCHEDELCSDEHCTVNEDDDLVMRGSHACCSDEHCRARERRQEAMERLGGADEFEVPTPGSLADSLAEWGD